jgi:hypothetical protein
MAAVTNTYGTYSQIGIREDLEDMIYNIDPTETPFASKAKRDKADNTSPEWQTDALAAAASNAQIEGDDLTSFTSATATVRLKNYTQILRKDVIVADTSRSVNTAGREDELPYQLAKRGKELKRDIEYALVQNQALDAGSSSSARKLGALESWISTNKTIAGTDTAGSTTPGYSSGALAAPTDGSTQGTFLESHLRTLWQSVWTAGGEPTMLMVDGFNKGLISRTFAGIATQYRENTGKSAATILASADIYVGDFGTIQIVPNRFVRGRTAFLLDMNYWKISVLRPIKAVELAKTGDAEKRMLITELTLKSLNQKASGKVVDLKTS